MDVFVQAAETFARERHQGQTRQDGITPSIDHPLQVAERLRDAGVRKPEILAAALLHDVLVATPTPPDALVARFGPRVAQLVDEVTPRADETRLEFLERVLTCSARAALVRVADRLEALQEPEGLDAETHGLHADEALTLVANALRNPRLDRLFPAERDAFHLLSAQLIYAAQDVRANLPRPRPRSTIRAAPVEKRDLPVES